MAEIEKYSAQQALNMCSDHEQEEIDMYCNTCSKPVCTKCVKGDHKDHDWDTMFKIAKALRRQTCQRKLEIRSVSKSVLMGVEDVIKSLTSDAESELALNSSELESTRNKIVEFVYKSFDEMESKCKTNYKFKMQHLQKCEEKMKSKRSRINFLIQNMEIGARDFSDSDLLELHDEIRGLLKEVQELAVIPKGLHNRMFYRTGSSDKTSLESLVGSMEVHDVSEAILENEFKIGDTTINSILPLSENEAWVHSTQTTTNKLVDKSGHIKRSVELECRVFNFAMSDDGIVYFCNPDTNHIQQVDRQGNIKSLFSTSPMIPLYIALTRSGDLLITLVDEDTHDRNDSSHRLVRRSAMTGETIMEFEFDKGGKNPLFSRPVSLLEHFNGNICVVNLYRDDAGVTKGNVHGLDCGGRVIFKYEGMDGDFNPLDVCCDREGNTFVTDSRNKRVHMIDLYGRFVRYLLSDESFTEKIYSIAIFGKTLWIGSRNVGVIKVFKF
ncbi:hypothetical protein FSP39_016393 [Pinctada imbricata]|uniref:B box-type domain-containing protein n=1 Tax=Pinctada imbricata TaxID=66713 RepID=A0AA88YE33_PINIB|nr:hypothetical protein FSP39_016393 [Pinctada imbricata]